MTDASVIDGAVPVLITIAVMGAAVVIVGPLARALARRLEGGAGREVQAELDELRSRVTQLEEGQTRLIDVEERLDFAERVLARPQEPDRVER
jgi:hypothetical protein